MRPQLALRLIGAGLVLQGLLFYGFATPLTIQIFPGASDEAVHVGMIMRRGLAAMSFLAGLVIFLVRDDGYRTTCLLYTSPSPRDLSTSRMPSSA